jgi:magnesium-transporting ATPase (P-type)
VRKSAHQQARASGTPRASQDGAQTPPASQVDLHAADMEGLPWHAMTPLDAMEALKCRDSGLSGREAARRLASFGPNELPRPRRDNALIVYVRQFKNPLVYLLLAATLVSLAVGELADAVFIFVVLQFNAVIGGLQEWKAASHAEALDELIRHRVTVRRDDDWFEVDAADLVPGDILRLQSGAHVAADLRLVSGQELTLDESLLTGESTPVSKDGSSLTDPATQLADRPNMLHAATTILSGRATGVVTSTGRRTEVGRIAEAMARGRRAAPPLVRRLERFSRVIGVLTMVLIAILAVTQFLQGTDLATVFLVAVALAVAAIPEGLPVAITIALAIATNRMQRCNVIVRALPAVEGLGACTLIASDKTGTLTRNELMVARAQLIGSDAEDSLVSIAGEGYAPEGDILGAAGQPLPPRAEEGLRRLAESASLCNEASVRFAPTGTEHLGDTVDVSFLVLAAKLGLDHVALQSELPQVGSIPYEPHRRFGASFTLDRKGDGGQSGAALVHVKGAAEVLIPMCADVDRDRVLADADRMAADGYRVLAVASGAASLQDAHAAAPEALRGLRLLGLVGLIDPVRAEVPEAVQQARQAGITVRMVTGDHPQTALAIARQLGIAGGPGDVATGVELAAARDPQAFDRIVRRARVFARVEPVQKLSIVESLRRAGEVVAVTGDGINDAPALTASDIGIAMGKDGTDVARGAADLILTDDNFASIVAGIREGRVAYDNVRKLIYLLIATGLGEIVLFFLAILFNLPLPLFAVQLLWLNLVTNGIQDVALAFERGEPGILRREPRPPHQRLFDRAMIMQVLVAGSYMGVMAFLFYAWCLDQGMNEQTARNLLLLLMVLFENAHALNARSETRSVLHIPLSANYFLVAAVVAAQGLHIGAMYLPGMRELLGVQPIALLDWVMVATVAASLILVMEIYKRLAANNHAATPRD